MPDTSHSMILGKCHRRCLHPLLLRTIHLLPAVNFAASSGNGVWPVVAAKMAVEAELFSRLPVRSWSQQLPCHFRKFSCEMRLAAIFLSKNPM